MGNVITMIAPKPGSWGETIEITSYDPTLCSYCASKLVSIEIDCIFCGAPTNTEEDQINNTPNWELTYWK